MVFLQYWTKFRGVPLIDIPLSISLSKFPITALSFTCESKQEI